MERLEATLEAQMAQ